MCVVWDHVKASVKVKIYFLKMPVYTRKEAAIWYFIEYMPEFPELVKMSFAY